MPDRVMGVKRRSFRGKLIAALLVFSAFLIAIICVTVSQYYKYQAMQKYGRLAYSYAKAAAEYIDGDRVTAYIETEETDAYYEQILDFLNAIRDGSGVLYYYVFIPYEDDLVYVWDAGEGEDICPLGWHEEYAEGDKEASMQAMAGSGGDEITITDDDTYGYIASAYYPIYNSAGESVALAGVDLPMSDISANMARFVKIIAVCIAATVILFIAFLYVILNKTFISPINQLNNAVKGMVGSLGKGDEMRLDIHTGDEIEELALSFGQMYEETGKYIRELAAITAEKERIGAELDVARKIQADMLPCISPAFPDRYEFEIYALMTPAREVGGDFYDFFLIDDDHLALVMADVSGKGVPAALFMMISKTLIKSAAQTGLSPKEVLERVNKQLCENNESDMFVTAWLGIMEISTGGLVCANAGHEYPAIKRKDGGFELFKDKHGFVLAGLETSKYREYELTLEAGDVIFVYTDGVTEATNSTMKLYQTDRMLAALNQNPEAAPKEWIASVKADIDKFVGVTEQFDDITMLCIEYKGA